MKRLAGTPELLDGPLDDPAALGGDVRDLRRINRWLGGVALSVTAVKAVAYVNAHASSTPIRDLAEALLPALLRAGRDGDYRRVLSTSFGFGGLNAAIVLGKPES
jgi:3-oxoacyl-(acyl-carrier-protein) synthase